MAGRETKEAFVTLATNDTYSLGCLVLEKSLRKVGTTRQLVVMVTSGVSEPMRNQLTRVFDLVQEVNLLDSKDPMNLMLLGRPDLNVTFTKLHCWRLTQFDKAVFLDADTLVIQNIDELFDREELSAAPDAGWPDCFNSGVFVFKPSQKTYESLLSFAITKGSFDGGDQGLLNMYFRDWSTKDIAKHLPFVFNVVSQAFYSYLPAFKQFRQNVKIVHFIGATKPWHHTYNTTIGKVTALPGTGHDSEFLQMWWDIFMEFVQPFLDSSLISLATPFISADSKTKDNLISLDNPPLHNLPRGEIYIKVVYPYVPPSIDVVYYSPSKPSTTLPIGAKDLEHKSEEKSELSVVKMPVVTRAYSSIESTYTEEPLSCVDPEKPLCIVYEAPVMTTKWEEVNKAEEKVKKGLESPPVSGPELHSNHEKNGLKGSLSEKVKNVEKETTKIAANVIPSECSESSSSKPMDGSKTHNGHVEGSVSSEGGLVGELASLKIASTGTPGIKIELTDRERRLNWEKGQIDYMDRDSFSNIQRKLDESLNGTTSPPALPSTTSPFSSSGIKSSTDPPVTSPPAKPASTSPFSSVGVKSSTDPTVTSPTAQPASTKPPLSTGGAKSSTETAVTSAKPASTTSLSSGVKSSTDPAVTSNVQPASTKPLLNTGGAKSSTETAVTSPPVQPASTKPLLSTAGEKSSTDPAVTSAKPASSAPPSGSGRGRGITITATSHVKPVSSEKKS